MFQFPQENAFSPNHLHMSSFISDTIDEATDHQIKIALGECEAQMNRFLLKQFAIYYACHQYQPCDDNNNNNNNNNNNTKENKIDTIDTGNNHEKNVISSSSSNGYEFEQCNHKTKASENNSFYDCDDCRWHAISAMHNLSHYGFSKQNHFEHSQFSDDLVIHILSFNNDRTIHNSLVLLNKRWNNIISNNYHLFYGSGFEEYRPTVGDLLNPVKYHISSYFDFRCYDGYWVTGQITNLDHETSTIEWEYLTERDAGMRNPGPSDLSKFKKSDWFWNISSFRSIVERPLLYWNWKNVFLQDCFGSNLIDIYPQYSYVFCWSIERGAHKKIKVNRGNKWMCAMIDYDFIKTEMLQMGKSNVNNNNNNTNNNNAPNAVATNNDNVYTRLTISKKDENMTEFDRKLNQFNQIPMLLDITDELQKNSQIQEICKGMEPIDLFHNILYYPLKYPNKYFVRYWVHCDDIEEVRYFGKKANKSRQHKIITIFNLNFENAFIKFHRIFQLHYQKNSLNTNKNSIMKSNGSTMASNTNNKNGKINGITNLGGYNGSGGNNNNNSNNNNSHNNNNNDKFEFEFCNYNGKFVLSSKFDGKNNIIRSGKSNKLRKTSVSAVSGNTSSINHNNGRLRSNSVKMSKDDTTPMESSGILRCQSDNTNEHSNDYANNDNNNNNNNETVLQRLERLETLEMKTRGRETSANSINSVASFGSENEGNNQNGKDFMSLYDETNLISNDQIVIPPSKARDLPLLLIESKQENEDMNDMNDTNDRSGENNEMNDRNENDENEVKSPAGSEVAFEFSSKLMNSLNKKVNVSKNESNKEECDEMKDSKQNNDTKNSSTVGGSVAAVSTAPSAAVAATGSGLKRPSIDEKRSRITEFEIQKYYFDFFNFDSKSYKFWPKNDRIAWKDRIRHRRLTKSVFHIDHLFGESQFNQLNGYKLFIDICPKHLKIPILYENSENKQMIKYFDLYKNISKIIHGQLSVYINKTARNAAILRKNRRNNNNNNNNNSNTNNNNSQNNTSNLPNLYTGGSSNQTDYVMIDNNGGNNHSNGMNDNDSKMDDDSNIHGNIATSIKNEWLCAEIVGIWKTAPALRNKIQRSNENGMDYDKIDSKTLSNDIISILDKWVGQIIVRIDITRWLSVVNIDLATVIWESDALRNNKNKQDSEKFFYDYWVSLDDPSQVASFGTQASSEAKLDVWKERIDTTIEANVNHQPPANSNNEKKGGLIMRPRIKLNTNFFKKTKRNGNV